jgi:hypothetical protein
MTDLFGTTAVVVIQDRSTLGEYCNRVEHGPACVRPKLTVGSGKS